MIIGRNKDSSRQSFIFPSLNSYILHSVNSYQEFVQFVAKRLFYLYANKSLLQPVAQLLSFLFVTLSSHCRSPIRFAIKGATSFSSQGKLQVARECYTAVEAGQVSLFALALCTSVRLCNCPSVSNAIALSRQALFQQPLEMTDALECQCVFGWSGEDLLIEAKTCLARVQAHCLSIKPPPTQLSSQQRPKDQLTTKILSFSR